MSCFVIGAVAFGVSALTLFSGFGLGTLLMPAFALFFPVEAAIAATAVVHFANNLFKVALVSRKADLTVVVRFAVPAAASAMLGAVLLGYFSAIPPFAEYAVGGRICAITPVKLIIASLIGLFALLELAPGRDKISFSPKYMPLGGAISGFFGGLSGHQGAFRTAFLIRVGLEKEVFIGTVVLCAVVVDASRLLIYGATFLGELGMLQQGHFGVVITGILSAVVGAFVGFRLIDRVTMKGIQVTVGIMLLILATALGFGLI